MKAWDYKDDTPFIPIKLIGFGRESSKEALVDTGARYCVLHEAIAEDLKLDKMDTVPMIGFGSKKKFYVDLCIGSIEIIGRIENIQFAVIKEKDYPGEAPKVVIGRNLLNKFKITLDGRNKKIYLE